MFLFFYLLKIDTVTERNALVKNVYPELRQYCRQKYGIEFQVKYTKSNLDWK